MSHLPASPPPESGVTPLPAAPGTPAAVEPTGSRWSSVLAETTRSSWLVTVAALVLALLVSGVLIAAADGDVQTTAGYLFARPTDFLAAVWTAVWGAYVALFQGAVVDTRASDVVAALTPLTETMTVSVPLILAGLGLAVGFRAGMFNIGAQGQIVLGAVVAGFVGFTWDLPVGLHLLLAMVGAVVGGGIWGGIAGWLKARTGANEVIVTIMLNYVALYLIDYLLTTDLFKRPGSANPISPDVASSARYPLLLGSDFRLHAGFLVALLAAVAVWWLLERSTIGFKFRAVGSNAHAARTAGISVDRTFLWVMGVSGALAGLAGSAQVLGTQGNLTGGVAGTFGFDAITVALLGRSRPLGVVLSGLLLGGLRAGGFAMQARTGTPIDVVLVVQSLVVLFIAAPPLVRAVFRLPDPAARRRARTTTEATA